MRVVAVVLVGEAGVARHASLTVLRAHCVRRWQRLHPSQHCSYRCRAASTRATSCRGVANARVLSANAPAATMQALARRAAAASALRGAAAAGSPRWVGGPPKLADGHMLALTAVLADGTRYPVFAQLGARLHRLFAAPVCRGLQRLRAAVTACAAVPPTISLPAQDKRSRRRSRAARRRTLPRRPRSSRRRTGAHACPPRAFSVRGCAHALWHVAAVASCGESAEAPPARRC